MLYPDACILIFVKAPVEGQVKTRLIPDVGPMRATQLYRELALHCIDKAVSTDLCQLQIWCAPDTSHEFFKSIQQQYQLPLYLQRGNDLGERMYNAISIALTTYRYVLIVGTDCPTLAKQDYDNALSALFNGNDAVIAPAEDGGYVLLGLQDIHREIFSDIEWSGASVFTDTETRLKTLGYHWLKLSGHRDMDRIEDILALQKNSAQWGANNRLAALLDNIVTGKETGSL